MPQAKIFKQEFASAFGTDVLKRCWLDDPVAIARLARHALSHAGGRETDELRDYRPRHGFDIEGGELQVKATDTRQLFDHLKERAYVLVAKAVTIPSFQQARCCHAWGNKGNKPGTYPIRKRYDHYGRCPNRHARIVRRTDVLVAQGCRDARVLVPWPCRCSLDVGPGHPACEQV